MADNADTADTKTPLDRAVDAAWAEMLRQAEVGKPGPYVDRDELSIIDGEVDMPALVRAVLTAIREPSDRMLSDGAFQIFKGQQITADDLDAAKRVWRGMTKAALTEGE